MRRPRDSRPTADKRFAREVGHLLGAEFEPNADRLGIRIYPDEIVAGGMAEHLVHRSDLPGTVSAIVIHVGRFAVPLPVTIAAQWGVDADTMFARALRNLPMLGDIRWQVLRMPDEDSIELDLLADLDASAHVLRADAFLPRAGEHGHLVALPVRHALVSWGIDANQPMRAVDAMMDISVGKSREGPEPITQHLFWRTPAGELRQQPVANDAEGPRLLPSPEFAPLLEDLCRQFDESEG